MSITDEQVPDFLLTAQNLKHTVLFTAAFALVFMNVYSPFDAKSWYNLNQIELFLYSSLSILTGMLVIAISRIIMHRRIRKRTRTLNYGQYGLWIAAEILSMSLVYAAFIKYVMNDTRHVLEVYQVSIKNTVLVLFIPYLIVWLYLSWQDKNKKIKQLSQDYHPGTPQSPRLIAFHDENKQLRFSLKADDLLYLKASDNYVNIYFIDQGKVARYMIRNRLKAFEEALQPTDVIRAHRSYMVNVNKVKMVRKEKGLLYLVLDAPEAHQVLVSKTYAESVIKAFSGQTS